MFIIFNLEFFGCRGSTPISSPHMLKYGGNTTCIALHTEKQLLLVDGGTGLICAGATLFNSGRYHEADIFVSHVHWDHVQGLPFFEALFSPTNRFDFYSEQRDGENFEQQLCRLMEPPMFPISPSAFRAQITYNDISCANPFMRGEVLVKPFRLTHPDVCTGFRFEH